MFRAGNTKCIRDNIDLYSFQTKQEKDYIKTKVHTTVLY